MPITVGDFREQLRRHDPAKPVCFCGSPAGLTFYRVKGRGDVLQIEFDQAIHRDREGRLVIHHISDGPENARDCAIRVDDLVERLDGEEWQPRALVFGGSADALDFTAVEDRGEWVSIEFAQRVTRGSGGALVVEETRDGQPVREEFAVLKTIDPSEATRGAFGAIRRQRPES